MNLNWKIDERLERAITDIPDGRATIRFVQNGFGGTIVLLTVKYNSPQSTRRIELPAAFGYNIQKAIEDAESMYLCI